jgi:phosphate transport system protein
MPLSQIEGIKERLVSYGRFVAHMIRRSGETWCEMRLMMRRMTSDLERMADHAVNIAGAVATCIARSPLRPDGLVVRMFEETLGMLDCGIQAFIGGDSALGQKVFETDPVVDELANRILDHASASMTKDPSTIEWNLAVLKIAGNLERIADLSTNIGENVIYSAEGRVIKHHHGEGRQ